MDKIAMFIDMLQDMHEGQKVTNDEALGQKIVSFMGINFVFDYDGNPIKITTDEPNSAKEIKHKEWVKGELEQAVKTHRDLCLKFPEKGSMVDRASYVALGRIEALEKVLKEMEK